MCLTPRGLMRWKLQFRSNHQLMGLEILAKLSRVQWRWNRRNCANIERSKHIWPCQPNVLYPQFNWMIAWMGRVQVICNYSNIGFFQSRPLIFPFRNAGKQPSVVLAPITNSQSPACAKKHDENNSPGLVVGAQKPMDLGLSAPLVAQNAIFCHRIDTDGRETRKFGVYRGCAVSDTSLC